MRWPFFSIFSVLHRGTLLLPQPQICGCIFGCKIGRNQFLENKKISQKFLKSVGQNEKEEKNLCFLDGFHVHTDILHPQRFMGDTCKQSFKFLSVGSLSNLRLQGLRQWRLVICELKLKRVPQACLRLFETLYSEGWKFLGVNLKMYGF